jgi:ribosomal-protein-alanine acetyltransferase
MSPRLREAKPDDAPALARIARDALPEGWSEASLRTSLARAEACALTTDPVVGFVLGWRITDEAEILTLAVDKDSRGQGFGRALVVALLARFRDAGVGRVTLEVRSSNDAACALYRSLGFETAGERASYYRDGEDALVLGVAL